MKKLCYITTVHGTIRSFLLKTIEYFHENTDWDITIICNYDEEFEKMLPDYIHYYPIPMKRGISVSGISAMLKMRKFFKQQKFDLVQYSTPNASLYAAVASFLARTEVRVYHLMGFRFLGADGIGQKILKTIEKFTCLLSTNIECVSKSNLKYGIENHIFEEKKAQVIWNGSTGGVDLSRFDISQKYINKKIVREKHDIPMNAFVFGFVGRITRDKGINELLASFKEIVDENTYLMVIGHNEVDSGIDIELYNWSKNHSNVVYIGPVINIQDYYGAMDVLVLPSYREGFGNVVIEAEAIGVPVIVSNIPGPIDAMEEYVTGMIVEKKDVTSLANTMKIIQQDTELYKTLSDNSFKYIKEHFDNEKLCEYILQAKKSYLNI